MEYQQRLPTRYNAHCVRIFPSEKYARKPKFRFFFAILVLDKRNERRYTKPLCHIKTNITVKNGLTIQSRECEFLNRKQMKNDTK